MNSNRTEKTYLIGELADLAGVSVRTLRHYDHIDLFKPSRRVENGYRQYGYEDLLKLQQILFFKELDFPLKQIKHILSDPQTDFIKLLHHHKQNLTNRINRLKTLLATLNKTMLNYTQEESMPLTDAELYEGFSRDQIDRYNREVRQSYDPQFVDQVNDRIRKMDKPHWEIIKQEGSIIAQNLAKLMDRDPQDSAVQALIKRQHAWIENFYPASAEVFKGLGEMYTTHPEFRAFYDQFAEGLADFMRDAMNIYADQNLVPEKLK